MATNAASLHAAGGVVSGVPTDVHAFITSTTALVALERGAEVEEEAGYKGARSARELERAGVLITRLVVADVSTGLYGRCLLTLESARGGPLPQSELGVRDIVELASQGGGASAAAAAGASSAGGSNGATAGGTKISSGVVYRIKESSITLVLDEFLEPAQRVGQLSVLKLANQVTYDRYKYGLNFLQREFASGGAGISSRLLRVLYGDVEPVSSSRRTQWIPFSQSLNASQREAVQQALDANDVHMIHGPPGTGKTTTVVELIRQLVARGLRVLACAPSNLAVDNLVEKLAQKIPVRTGKQTHDMQRALADMAAASNVAASSSAAFDAALSANTAAASSLSSNRGYDIRLCRLGHPARIIPSVLKYTLDSVVAQSDAEAVCSAMRADMSALNKAVEKSKDRAERNSMRREVRELQRALRDRERQAITESLHSTEVLCCTLVNAASKLMDPFSAPGAGFDVVVIDEAAQALEVACLLPILKGRKLILAGDPCQLGPTVKSKEAVAGGLERTLFDRLYAKPYGQRITTMLVEQYRMNGKIMQWSSDELYQGRLIGPPSITSHLLSDLEGVASTEDTRESFVVIDTAGLNMHEDEPNSTATATTGGKMSDMGAAQQRSKSNHAEALLLKQHLDALIAAGVSPKDIGLITPYNGQVTLLREMLLDPYVSAQGLEIGTVDGFQGREKEAILISLVRSNPAAEVGFLAEDRRINVAITRARRHVCLVLDSSTVTSHKFLARLVDYASEQGDYRMAEDPNEVRQDWSGPAPGTGTGTGSVSANASPGRPVAPHAAGAGAESKQDDATAHQSPVVSKPRVKKERVRPSLPASLASSASAAASSSGTVQPVPEEWSEARLVSLCEEVLRRGRLFPAEPHPPDERTRFAFPPSLNSFERHLVHEVAERVGGKELSHGSQGTGMQRFIQLKYVWDTPAAKTAAATPASSVSAAATAVAPPPPPPGETHGDPDDTDAADLADIDAPGAGAGAGAGAMSKKRSKKQAKKQAQMAAAQGKQLELERQQEASSAREAARQKAIDAMELRTTGKVSAAATRPTPAAAPSAAAPASATAAAASSSAFAALALADDADGAEVDAEEDASTSAASVAAPAAPVVAPSKAKKAKKKKAKADEDGKVGEAEEEEDLDSLLAEFGHDTCKFAGCATRVGVMGFTCAYCREKHCVKHLNPVLHGCAAAHKTKQLADMQAALKKANGGGSGGGAGGHTMRASDKALLQAKMEKKLAADKQARTKQTKKDEKKK